VATIPFFISHQGCPHTCSFCDQHIISGALGTLPTPDEICSRVDAWRAGARGTPLEVAYFGGSFTALPRSTQARLLSPLQPLLASGVVSSIRVSTRPDCLDGEQVAWLAAHGVRAIELGIQSLEDRVLAASGRGHDAAAGERALSLVAGQGLEAVAQLMPGLPADNLSSSLDSLRRSIAAGASFVRLYPAIVLRHTELERRVQEGSYHPLSLDDGIAWCKVLLHDAMNAGVTVLRIGLQADAGLNDATIVAGPWHPAFGYLVRCELFYDLLCTLLAGSPAEEPVVVRCHPKRLSEVVGHCRRNLERLADAGRSRVKVQTDAALPHGSIAIESLRHNCNGDILTDIKYNTTKERICVKNP